MNDLTFRQGVYFHLDSQETKVKFVEQSATVKLYIETKEALG